MEAAGNAIMTIIQTHLPDAMAASTVAGSLIYSSEDKRRENLFQKINRQNFPESGSA
jgi:hypothetical protein